MSTEHDDLILTRSADSTLTLAQWLRVGAAAGATWQLDPAGARRLARAIEDDERRAAALGSAVETMQRELRTLRACFLALAAINLATWWLL
jgi:ABC-type branched-subunit amino acid transport system permease subunit